MWRPGEHQEAEETAKDRDATTVIADGLVANGAGYAVTLSGALLLLVSIIMHCWF